MKTPENQKGVAPSTLRASLSIYFLSVQGLTWTYIILEGLSRKENLRPIIYGLPSSDRAPKQRYKQKQFAKYINFEAVIHSVDMSDNQKHKGNMFFLRVLATDLSYAPQWLCENLLLTGYQTGNIC